MQTIIARREIHLRTLSETGETVRLVYDKEKDNLTVSWETENGDVIEETTLERGE